MARFLTDQDEANANRTDPKLEAEEDAMWEERYQRRTPWWITLGVGSSPGLNWQHPRYRSDR